MKRPLFILPLLFFAGLTLGLMLALLRTPPQNPASHFAQHIGDAAPTAAIGAYDPAAWHGKAVIVNFFASWCAPCQAEHPMLLQLQQQKIPVIGIAYRDKPAAIHQFLRHGGNPYALLAEDSSGLGGIDWGLTGVPETFLLDKDGIIRWHLAGPLTQAIIDNDLLPAWRKAQ